MNKLLLLTLIYCSILFYSSCENRQQQISDKPNIILLFTDDQTYSSIRALGNNEIITPNMDRLVNDGTTFNNTFNMGGWNGAICTASRSMMNSGRSLWRVNKFRQNWLKGDSLDQTWGKLMSKQGYDTYMTGKWHIDAPANKLFDQSPHVRPGMPGDEWEHNEMVEKFATIVADGTVQADEIMPIGYNRPLSENDSSWSPVDPKFGGFWEGGKHWSEVVKDHALSFINEAKNKDNPFFMYLAFNAPHDPRQAPQEFQDMYSLDEISVPKSWQSEYPNQELIGNGPSLRDEALAPFPRTEYATKVHTKEYYAIITHLDEQIGQILDALEASGKKDNTYIFFTSDHGLSMGRHGLLGKQSLYDHSIKPPLIVAGPDVPKNKRIDADVYLQDVMATSLELAGIPKPEYLEFNSLMGLVQGKQDDSNYPAIYGAYTDTQRMVRKDGFKLLVFPKANKILLFDLEKDPEEMNDLSGEEDYKEKISALAKELIALQNHYEDPLDLSELLNSVI
ncbi:MAG: sulfatase-like hydrolase/transferase [Reichenbachiella sp.]